MIWDRFVGYVIMARGVLTWFWPFMVAVAVTANMVVLVMLVVNQAESLKATRESTLTNRRLIERGNPCVRGDPPESEACQAKAASDARLADALAAVQAQHDEQARQLADAVERLVELQERQHGSIPNATPRTTLRPRTTVTATTTTTTAAPEPTTTTTTKPKGKKP